MDSKRFLTGFKGTGGSLRRKTFRAIAGLVRTNTILALATGVLVTGCLQNGSGTGGGGAAASGTGSGTKSLGTSTIPGTTSTETQCLVFKNNSRDYSACTACKKTLCPCTKYYPAPRSNICEITDIDSCTVDLNQLVECVHNNNQTASGSCVGLKCTDGQVADFNSCVCRDAIPPTSIGPAPGYEDQTTPYMQPGFYVSNRACPAADEKPVHGLPTSFRNDCLLVGAGIGAAGSLYTGKAPITEQKAPANIYPDVGYLRWDLALDASQYPPGLPMIYKQGFYGTWSTFPISFSMYAQLKPNTVPKYPTSIGWRDCVEHFSGYNLSSALPVLSSTASCEGYSAFAAKMTKTSEYAYTALIRSVSANGTAANANITTYDGEAANPKLAVGIGLLKADSGVPNAATGFGYQNPADVSMSTTVPVKDSSNTQGAGLFSNIGYYKYTWGVIGKGLDPATTTAPGTTDGWVIKKKPTATGADGAELASPGPTVSGQIAVNMNFGYSPASAVESTAMAPSSITGSVPTRDCSTTTTSPYHCATTAVYRTPGGGVAAQAFSPAFSSNRHSSTVSVLPAGVTAVSTPKIIEDVSQLDESTDAGGNARRPARLRTFVRGADGNIHMSRFENGKWHNWMSLGRPWVCDPEGAACGTLWSSTTVPPIYQPIRFLSRGALTRGASTAAPSVNDGISIASEPVVASFMMRQPRQDGQLQPAALDTARRPMNGYAITAAPVAGTPVTPQKGVIGVFVRVSQVSSVTGRPGPYHNSVWYTMSVSQNRYTPGIALDFDDPLNWTQWMLVDDHDAETTNGGASFRIQGNPVVIAAPDFANSTITEADMTMRFYVFGTSAYSNFGDPATYNPVTGGNINIMHPPIAPTSGTIAEVTNVDEGDGAGFRRKWNFFGYGMMLARTSINIQPLWARSTVGWERRFAEVGANLLAGMAALNGNYNRYLGYDWATVRYERGYNTAGTPEYWGIVSDWTYEWVNRTNLWDQGRVRLFANIISSRHLGNGSATRNNGFCKGQQNALEPDIPAAGSGSTAPLRNTVASTCLNEKRVQWFEFDLGAETDNEAGYTGSMISLRCSGTYFNEIIENNQANADLTLRNNDYIGFTGNIHAINLSSFPNSGRANPASVSTSSAMLLFGRAVCPNASGCDPVNPGIAYLTTNAFSECSDNNEGTNDRATTRDGTNERTHRMHYSGQMVYHAEPPAAPQIGKRFDTAVRPLTRIGATADVIPFLSYGLAAADYEVPTYIITRDVSGLLTHGYWDARTGSDSTTQGVRLFQFFASGVFTN